ncbi:palmitoyltransferase with autoacylation activity Pfa4 [Phyllosticta citriasiana]|uniref:Palmitoyltransferase PFA4 n=1 Tax=Phyllosticta citriasiana TaxID=595635 RepID=A0ABR1KUA9_9PEZI
MGYQLSSASLAASSVLALIAFLGTSQYLFLHIDPAPFSRDQYIKLNVLIFGVTFSHIRAWMADPGRVPQGWTPGPVRVYGEKPKTDKEEVPQGGNRWCSKCEAPKPPRAHHCKTCGRCIPKMDHHCPWIANCVSYTTYPHFFRILLYGTAAMWYNEYHLWLRLQVIWEKRRLPSYLGPTAPQLLHLFALTLVNTLTLVTVGLMLLRFGKMLVENVTTIETWEMERHDTLVHRAKFLGGYLAGPDGARVRIRRVEFPYDIGVWPNLVQAFGTRNILAWFWPFAATPSMRGGAGLNFEVNGFEDASVAWPPPDPDRMPRIRRTFNPEEAFTYRGDELTRKNGIDIEAFRRRQEEDLKRWQTANNGTGSNTLQRQRPFHERFDSSGAIVPSDVESEDDSEELESEPDVGDGGADADGEEAWKNSEGETLKDFGVDQDAEFYDEDDVPLSELIRRRQAMAAQQTS